MVLDLLSNPLVDAALVFEMGALYFFVEAMKSMFVDHRNRDSESIHYSEKCRARRVTDFHSHNNHGDFASFHLAECVKLDKLSDLVYGNLNTDEKLQDEVVSGWGDDEFYGGMNDVCVLSYQNHCYEDKLLNDCAYLLKNHFFYAWRFTSLLQDNNAWCVFRSVIGVFEYNYSTNFLDKYIYNKIRPPLFT